MKKPKSAAKLAAEASDKLDQLAEAEKAELMRAYEKYDVICFAIRKRFAEKHETVRSMLSGEAAEKLCGMRGELPEVTGAGYVTLNTIPTDEPTHLREVMP